MNDTPEPSLPSEEEICRRHEEYLRRIRNIKIEEVLKNTPIRDGEPLPEQLEAALQQYLDELQKEILWPEIRKSGAP